MAEKLSFEQSMRRLEEIARTLEQGEVGLDESIELYSQAAKLLAACQKKIDAAQLKIEKINFQTPMQKPTTKRRKKQMGMESFKQRLSEYAVLTENTLQQYLPEEMEDIVTEAMRYSLLAGGKRLRCALALEFCLALGGSKEDVLPFACALEMVHAYSLIHDDLPCMDDDDMRRGKPSCHIAFGEANALLAGDGLLTKAFEVMAQQSKIPPERTVLAVGVLAQAIGHHGMIGGQRMDLQNEGKRSRHRGNRTDQTV